LEYQQWEKQRSERLKNRSKVPHVVKLLKDPFATINTGDTGVKANSV
jgi:hypothetical protein